MLALLLLFCSVLSSARGAAMPLDPMDSVHVFYYLWCVGLIPIGARQAAVLSEHLGRQD